MDDPPAQSADNPLSAVELERDETDLRRRRRRLTDAEFEAAVRSAEASRPPVVKEDATRPHGEARAVVYLVAAYTGFRTQELGTLTADAFDLAGQIPAVVVAGRMSKRGTEDVSPLPPVLVPQLAAFLAGKPAGRRVWPGMWWWRAAAMLREDLKRCGVPYRDARGRQADFHSLQPLFIGKMMDAGVDAKTAQKMARHSTITLTHDVYRDEAELAELVAAAARLTRAGQGRTAG